MSRDEIDAAIARHAESELLVRPALRGPQEGVRVTGPFTVESLSPHRVLDDDDRRRPSAGAAAPTPTAPFVDDDPRQPPQGRRPEHGQGRGALASTASTPTPARGSRPRASSPTPTARRGRSRSASGPSTARSAPTTSRRRRRRRCGAPASTCWSSAASPSTRTAGETAPEFAPDGSTGSAVAAEERKLGRLRVLLARMNPDLAMGDELLKKTGAGNLFMVFGEPDVDIDAPTSGELEVEIRGVDVYDPTTGEVRSGSTDDIACWFIDTQLQRRELLRPPRLLHRRRRPLRAAPARLARRHRRGRLGVPLPTAAGRSPCPRPARSPSRSSTTTATRC